MKNYDEVDHNNFVLITEKEEHRDFYKRENHCCFCGHELIIKTKKKINSSVVTETSHCPSCIQDMSNKTHKLN